VAIRAALLVASAIALVAGALVTARRQQASPSIPAANLRASFATAAPDWLARLEQDETQEACSRYRNAPPEAVAEVILAREKARITFPADGKLMGDWKKGEALAQSGYGGRYTDVPASAPNGGNCYACHQLDARELSYGTLGPSLASYGKIHGFAPAAVRAVYERIYNPEAAIPCANMPRLGANAFLTIDQIRDLVAYVMSPESPVNR
jgi:L-cysteine S-thiosulfotransferase